MANASVQFICLTAWLGLIGAVTGCSPAPREFAIEELARQLESSQADKFHAQESSSRGFCRVGVFPHQVSFFVDANGGQVLPPYEFAYRRLPENSGASDSFATGEQSPPAASQSPKGDGGLGLFSRPDDVFRLDLMGTHPSTEQSTTYDESLFSAHYVRRVSDDIVRTFTAPASWDGKDWLIAGGVAAGVGVTMAFDHDIQRAVHRNRNSTANRLLVDIEPLGAEYAAGVIGAFYLGGEFLNDPRAKSVALDGISASLIASGLIDLPLKYAVGRSRPYQGHNSGYVPFSGNDSFPSGHATEAFAIATVVAEHYDSPLIKITSYGLASAVGYARLNSNSHWASDVVAGAAIGIFVGEMVVRLPGDHRVSLSPMFGPDMKGLQLSWTY